jgi:N-acetylneuraminate synthase
MFSTSAPYFIAEIGVNHEGDLELAREMIRQVSRAGGHAAKFQTYKADLIAAEDSPAYWDQTKEPTPSQHKLFQKYDNFSQAEYEALYEECKRNNIDFMSTPFDVECLPWLMPLMDVVKIASADITNDILVEAVADYKKPMIVSTGASNDSEINHVVELLTAKNVPSITLLHCVLLYPTPSSHGFLSRIRHLENKFSGRNIHIGYSDHIPPQEAGNDQVIIAAGMGCKVIEKHFTHDKTLPGNDHYHALDEHDLALLIDRLRKSVEMMSDMERYSTEGLASQSKAIEHARRGLYFKRALEKGMEISLDDLIAKRPAVGISPSEYKKVVGLRVNRQVESGAPVTWGEIDEG